MMKFSDKDQAAGIVKHAKVTHAQREVCSMRLGQGVARVFFMLVTTVKNR